MERILKVSADQFDDAEKLAMLYGYVISVDDCLVLAEHPRSPLVIGLGGTYTVKGQKTKLQSVQAAIQEAANDVAERKAEQTERKARKAA